MSSEQQGEEPEYGDLFLQKEEFPSNALFNLVGEFVGHGNIYGDINQLLNILWVIKIVQLLWE